MTNKFHLAFESQAISQVQTDYDEESDSTGIHYVNLDNELEALESHALDIERLTLTTEAYMSIYDHIQTNGVDTGTKMFINNLSRISTVGTGLSSRSFTPATENYSNQTALESIGSTIKDFFVALFNMIKEFFKRILSFFNIGKQKSKVVKEKVDKTKEAVDEMAKAQTQPEVKQKETVEKVIKLLGFNSNTSQPDKETVTIFIPRIGFVYDLASLRKLIYKEYNSARFVIENNWTQALVYAMQNETKSIQYVFNKLDTEPEAVISKIDEILTNLHGAMQKAGFKTIQELDKRIVDGTEPNTNEWAGFKEAQQNGLTVKTTKHVNVSNAFYAFVNPGVNSGNLRNDVSQCSLNFIQPANEAPEGSVLEVEPWPLSMCQDTTKWCVKTMAVIEKEWGDITQLKNWQSGYEKMLGTIVNQVKETNNTELKQAALKLMSAMNHYLDQMTKAYLESASSALNTVQFLDYIVRSMIKYYVTDVEE